MLSKQVLTPYICRDCLQRSKRRFAGTYYRNQSTIAQKSPLSSQRSDDENGEPTTSTDAKTKGRQQTQDHAEATFGVVEAGAMTQRLSELSEVDLTGTRKEDVENAGFSADLKAQLLSRIESASCARAVNPTAFAVSELPSSAGAGTRANAAAEAWTGTESVADGALRMLTDAHKPIRQPVRIPGPTRPPKRVDTGRPGGSKAPSPGVAKGTRLANARDRSSMYGYLKDGSLTQAERDKVRAELKERFTPSARPMPATLQGLASLANERIEDAIQRGQFANLPSRGKKIERDHNASSPFLDTTEYFMNKIIQKQDIVPPWIEKQQELVAAVGRFRARLRADWRRHAARVIASRGGALEEQVARAEGYARAEMVVNPPRKKTGAGQAEAPVVLVDEGGHMSQISLAGDLATQPVVNQAMSSPQEQPLTAEAITPTLTTDTAPLSDTFPSAQPAPTPPPGEPAPITTTSATDPLSSSSSSSAQPQTSTQPSSQTPIPTPTHQPFRDPTYIHHETPYLTHAITHLNALTRSYNLQAPSLAQKPYYSLQRELLACYSDVAPLLPSEIRDRALGRRADCAEGEGVARKRGVLGGLVAGGGGGGGGHVGRVRDEVVERRYGFREFVRDLFARRTRGS